MAIAVIVTGCGMHRKLSSLRESPVHADLALPVETFIPTIESGQDDMKDTTEVNEPGSVLIMNAVKDENGEMTATDVIKAAMVTARFRNVAERHGKIDLNFQVIVPKSLQDSRWQLALYPDLFMLDDSTRLEPVIITGAQYRKKQLKGYEHYRKFLDSITSDYDRFVNAGQLELFIKRNIPKLYRFRTDSSYVSDEEFASVYGITEQSAIEHYTNRFRVSINERRKDRTDKMYRKYVKAPIVREGIRIDTVIITPDGDFIYDYVQTIGTCPGLRKADIRLCGAIMEEGEPVMKIPQSRPLTFYISSLSAFTDKTEKYCTKVISRRAEANTICYVDFAAGKSDIDLSLGHNDTEIGKIRKNLADLAADKIYDLDSIVVTASCSPEGKENLNKKLSSARAASISGYFGKYLDRCRDSIRKETGVLLDMETGRRIENGHETGIVKFISRTAGENWTHLDVLVRDDSTLTEGAKHEYLSIRKETDPDRREDLLSYTDFYRYIREKMYPRLRTVRFDFFLHRKGMISDTVRTTELDTTYMSGVRAIEDRDYRRAISILRPYGDYNLAVAYCAMDYNASALEILLKERPTDRVHYMLAVLYSRTGEYRKAAEHYTESCRLNPMFVHRGNLDPEISLLIRKFNLNRQNDEP